MLKSRLLYFLISLTLIVTLTGGFLATTVFAQDATPVATPSPAPTPTTTPTPTAPPDLTLKCDIPSYIDNSGSTFTYDVDVAYSGDNTITVNFSLTNPPGWTSYITYTSKEVSSLPLGPESYGTPDSKTISINLSPNAGDTPAPGSYTLGLKATSGQLTKTINLTATVKDTYSFSMSNPNNLTSTTATAGKANHFTVNLDNTGSAALDNIKLSSNAPKGWNVSFNPSQVNSLGAGQTQQDDVIITPPTGNSVAGDYSITLTASDSHASNSMDVRVTVNTTSIWGTVSIVIVVVVIGGLAVLFLRLGRR